MPSRIRRFGLIGEFGEHLARTAHGAETADEQAVGARLFDVARGRAQSLKW